jgi:hypothetical protein
MWFTFVTARLFISLSFQPRLTATLLRSCSAVNSPIRQVGLAPTFKPASPAQALLSPVNFDVVAALPRCPHGALHSNGFRRFPRVCRLNLKSY